MFTILSTLKEQRKKHHTNNRQLYCSNGLRPRAGPESTEICGNISESFGPGLPGGIFSSRQYINVTLIVDVF